MKKDKKTYGRGEKIANRHLKDANLLSMRYELKLQ